MTDGEVQRSVSAELVRATAPPVLEAMMESSRVSGWKMGINPNK